MSIAKLGVTVDVDDINLVQSCNLENQPGPSNSEFICDKERHLLEEDFHTLTSPKYKTKSPIMSPKLKSDLKVIDKKRTRESTESIDRNN